MYVDLWYQVLGERAIGHAAGKVDYEWICDDTTFWYIGKNGCKFECSLNWYSGKSNDTYSTRIITCRHFGRILIFIDPFASPSWPFWLLAHSALVDFLSVKLAHHGIRRWVPCYDWMWKFWCFHHEARRIVPLPYLSLPVLVLVVLVCRKSSSRRRRGSSSSSSSRSRRRRSSRSRGSGSGSGDSGGRSASLSSSSSSSSNSSSLIISSSGSGGSSRSRSRNM